MGDKIHKEVIESWNSWKYDILDMNKSEWSKDDQLVLETNLFKLKKLHNAKVLLEKELHDRKTND